MEYRFGPNKPKFTGTDEEWEKAGKNKQPAWCYYNNDPANGAKYGKLYNWYAVNDPRGLAPKGWHVPSDDDWFILRDYLGGKEIAGSKMKSETDWARSGNGTNRRGFSGLPGGFRGSHGPFYGIGGYIQWWSSSEFDIARAWDCRLYYNSSSVERWDGGKGFGSSVRCIKD